jgi:hypothetical protein
MVMDATQYEARGGVFHDNAAIILVMRWVWTIFACVGMN